MILDLLLAGLPGAVFALDVGQAWTTLDVEARVALLARRLRRASR